MTGLALYNMGRSHSHYHTDHYYYDDYYRTRYYGSDSSYRPQEQERPKDEATCTLRVVENGKLQLLKIPCEIVSTFTEGSQKVTNPSETQLNKTVCTTNTTVIRNTNTTSSPTVQANATLANVTNQMLTPTNISNVNVTAQTQNITAVNVVTIAPDNISGVNIPSVNVTGVNIPSVNVTAVNMTSANVTNPTNSSNVLNTVKEEFTVGNKTTSVVRVLTTTETIVNTTVCIISAITTDPMKAKGPPIDPTAMKCSVDIKTKDAYFRNDIDCNTLVQYSKKPLTSPKQQSAIMPDREKLKSWLDKPPWWMSLFIAA